MAFSKHPHTKDREAKNAAALRAAGLDPKAVGQFWGELVYPGDPDYNKDRQMSNAAFQAYPPLIAYCLTISDIQWCLNNPWSYPVVCRSGGHSTAGYCVLDNRLVIDMTSFNYAIVDLQSETAVAGAGINFGAFNDYLTAYGVHVPGGGCPDVRVGGYMQGGGYGFTSRQFGMHCDNVVWFSMMLANGGVVFASPTVNGDLYWAVRGGTGNNFGVLINVQYKVHPLQALWGAWLQWPLDSMGGVSRAAAALVELQQNYMAGSNDSRFGYMVLITTQGAAQQPVMMLRAAFTGTEQQLDALLKPLIATGGTSPPNFPMKQYGTYSAINRDLLSSPYEIPQQPDLPRGQMWAEDKQSGYIETQLQQSDWVKILNYYLESTGANGPPNTTVVIEPYGGAINKVPLGDCAFIHRTPAMDFFVDVFWNTANAAKDKPKVQKYLDGFMALMKPYFNGRQYQNYPRRGTVDYPKVYWDRAYWTLTQVKQKYDPNNYFHFPQSIGYSTDIPPIKTKADPFLNQPIVYQIPPPSET